jgi:hypothetical protein
VAPLVSSKKKKNKYKLICFIDSIMACFVIIHTGYLGFYIQTKLLKYKFTSLFFIKNISHFLKMKIIKVRTSRPFSAEVV